MQVMVHTNGVASGADMAAKVSHLPTVIAEASATLPPLWQVGAIPFAALLLCIAIFPLIPATHHWWEKNFSKVQVSVACGVATLAYLILSAPDIETGAAAAGYAVKHAILDEYIPFIVLLASLFAVSGGIAIHTRARPTPFINLLFLIVGTSLASVLGTTGASVLLIRPLLRVNERRTRKVHTVIFFIFCVSNCGGLLLPIGDPPLFLGYLKGVPFFWTLVLWKEWIIVNGALLCIYYTLERRAFRAEPLEVHVERQAAAPGTRFRMEGLVNILWLAFILGAVAFVVPGRIFPLSEWLAIPFTTPNFLREGIMVVVLLLSLWTSPFAARNHNSFNWHPIAEVAALFIGIFVAMQVPMQVLRSMGGGLGVNTPDQFFWATGVLSAVLDNAPTYLVFLQTAIGLAPPDESGPGILLLTGGETVHTDVLIGISCGAVFMGAMTYIGNGPNFMVKAIAEAQGIKMPGFFGYIGWSAACLLPPMVVIAIVVI
jgi:Na+/H+ antiporter NhaD/arsenite permease-like protein